MPKLPPQTRWLVLLGLKVWDPRSFEHYVEIEQPAYCDAYNARWAGLMAFEAQVQYEPNVRKKLEAARVTLKDVCAKDAIPLD